MLLFTAQFLTGSVAMHLGWVEDFTPDTCADISDCNGGRIVKISQQKSKTSQK